MQHRSATAPLPVAPVLLFALPHPPPAVAPVLLRVTRVPGATPFALVTSWGRNRGGMAAHLRPAPAPGMGPRGANFKVLKWGRHEAFEKFPPQ